MTEQFFIDVSGGRLAGEHTGSGSPLVFLHAGVGDKRMWRKQLVEFGRTHHAIAYDRRGFGTTATDDVPFSDVEDLLSVLNHFDIKQATLIGCSMGGGIAVNFALAWPERVKTLVLIAPGIVGAPDPATLPEEFLILLEELKKADAAGDIERINEIEAHIWLDGPTSAWHRVDDTKIRRLFLDMNRIALRVPQLTQKIQPESAYERLAELMMPTLVLYGDRDFADLRDVCLHIAATLPDAHYREIVDVAHLPSLEKPKLVNELLRTFIDDVVAGADDAS